MREKEIRMHQEEDTTTQMITTIDYNRTAQKDEMDEGFRQKRKKNNSKRKFHEVTGQRPLYSEVMPKKLGV